MNIALPPGQQLARKLPIEGESVPIPEALNPEEWRLTIGGEVGRPAAFSLDRFMELPQVERKYDIHCVTRWSKPACVWKGVLFAEIIALVGPKPSARFVRFVSYSERGHDTSLPLDYCLAQEVLFAHTLDGSPLTVAHGFPLRTVVPGRYFYKSLKWIREVLFVEDDVPGYWERNGYHNNADFTREERYVSGNLPPPDVARLRVSGNFQWLGGRPLFSLDLRGAGFSGKNLSGVVMKHCLLCEADLRGGNLRGANLSNSDLRGADLRGANLTDADISGVAFMGADLRGCLLRNALMSATEFVRPGEPEPLTDGLDLAGANLDGLSDLQLEFLRGRGVKT